MCLCAFVCECRCVLCVCMCLNMCAFVCAYVWIGFRVFKCVCVYAGTLCLSMCSSVCVCVCVYVSVCVRWRACVCVRVCVCVCAHMYALGGCWEWETLRVTLSLQSLMDDQQGTWFLNQAGHFSTLHNLPHWCLTNTLQGIYIQTCIKPGLECEWVLSILPAFWLGPEVHYWPWVTW